MKSRKYTGICLAIACVWTSPAAMATPAPQNAQDRRIGQDYSVQVLVPQSEIKSDINPSNIAVATGGGLLAGLVQAAVNAERTKKAEALIEPIRASLMGFDADALALDATKAAFSQAVWKQPAAVTFSKDSSLLGKSTMLDGNTAPQMAFVEYGYDLSPDFASVRVRATLHVANKEVPARLQKKPEDRLSSKNLAYSQTSTSVVSLRNATKDHAANAALWSADGGKATREALRLAFTDLQTLLPRSLALTPADMKAMKGKDKPKRIASGFTGRLQEKTPSSSLLWADGFIHVQTLP
jgi:hypothetical protein